LPCFWQTNHLTWPAQDASTFVSLAKIAIFVVANDMLNDLAEYDSGSGGWTGFLRQPLKYLLLKNVE
jgi:hypothetical protein